MVHNDCVQQDIPATVSTIPTAAVEPPLFHWSSGNEPGPFVPSTEASSVPCPNAEVPPSVPVTPLLEKTVTPPTKVNVSPRRSSRVPKPPVKMDL